MRIAIFGFPYTGKSTFAESLHKKLGLPVFHTDEYSREYGYRESIYEIIKDLPESFIVEGIHVARMLRADADPEKDYQFKIDKLYVMTTDLDNIKKRLPAGMTYKKWLHACKGLSTVFNEWLDRRPNVEIINHES